MAQPTKKFFGSFDLQELTDAIVAVKKNDELGEYKGKQQVIRWENDSPDGNMETSLRSIYVKDSLWSTKETRFMIGNLRESHVKKSGALSFCHSTTTTYQLLKKEILPF